MSTVYLETGGSDGVLGNASIVRTAVPVGRPTAVAESPARPSTRRPWKVPAVHPRTGAATARPEQLRGDPILQLERSRNPAPPNAALYMAPRHPGKRGDMEGIGDALPMRRESPNATRVRRNAISDARRRIAHDSRPVVKLGTKGDGLAFMKGPRIRPALPNGVEYHVAPTAPLQLRTTSYFETTMPAGTAAALAQPVPVHALPATRIASSSIARVDVSPVTIARADAAAGTTRESGGESLGRFLFMAGALVLAIMVVRHGRG